MSRDAAKPETVTILERSIVWQHTIVEGRQRSIADATKDPCKHGMNSSETWNQACVLSALSLTALIRREEGQTSVW